MDAGLFGPFNFPKGQTYFLTMRLAARVSAALAAKVRGVWYKGAREVLARDTVNYLR